MKRLVILRAGTAWSASSGVPYKNENFDPNQGLLLDGQFVSGNPSRAFNADAYIRPPDYGFGNLSQYYQNVRQPGGFSGHAKVMKNFNFTESREFYLNVRVEALNMFNHPNFGSLNTNPNSIDFGGVDGKSGSRVMQIGAWIFF